MTRGPVLGLGSRGLEPKETRELEDDAAALEVRVTGGQGVAPVAIDDEEVASRSVLPAETNVRRKAVRFGVVLNERAYEASWRHGVGRTKSNEIRREGPFGEIDPVQ